MKNADDWRRTATRRRVNASRSGTNGCQHPESQCTRILELLRRARDENRSLELPEILQLRIAQFCARIRELRLRGFDIENELSRDEKRRVCSRYFLKYDPERDRNGR